MTFESLRLTAPLLKALYDKGYEKPTPIQEQAIPVILDGNDVLGCAQTGTGKTAAFAIPVIERLYPRRHTEGYQGVRALVLTPTRELTNQVYECFVDYASHTELTQTAIFGGIPRKVQIDALQQGADIVIATPGRLLDLVGLGHIDLSGLEYFILDEADTMLRLGFIEEVKRIIEIIPDTCCALLFSATFPHEVTLIANDLLDNPVQIKVDAPQITADGIEQTLYFVGKDDRTDLLEYILLDENITSALVFTNTRQEAEDVYNQLNTAGIAAEVIHSEKSQQTRNETLKRLREGQIRVLVTTDLIARGIDIMGISHVINYGLPPMAETYVHRVGRTARAGEQGIAISFCMPEELPQLMEIQTMLRKNITVVDGHPFIPVTLRKELILANERFAARKAEKPSATAKPEKKIGYFERQKRALAQKRKK